MHRCGTLTESFVSARLVVASSLQMCLKSSLSLKHKTTNKRPDANYKPIALQDL